MAKNKQAPKMVKMPEKEFDMYYKSWLLMNPEEVHHDDGDLTDVSVMAKLLSLIQHAHDKLYELTGPVLDKIKKRQYSNEELADLGFLFREMESLLDETRKDAKARKELTGKLLAFLIIAAQTEDISNPDKVRGRLATARPDVRVRAKLPKKGTPEYERALDYFYIPRRAVDEGIMKIDWNKASDFLTTLVEEGKKVPDEFKETYPEYKCVFTKISKQEKENGETDG